MNVLGRHTTRGELASDLADRVIEHRLGIVARRENRLPAVRGLCRSLGWLATQK
jgi:hypothetical protein